MTARPGIYLALPPSVRAPAAAALRQAGWVVVGGAACVREALGDASVLQAGIIFYDVVSASAEDIAIISKAPCAGVSVDGARALIPVLDPRQGPACPPRQRSLFLPVPHAAAWPEMAALTLARRLPDPLRVITVASPFGGCGKTTIAENLAALIHYRFGLSVGLLDFAMEGPLVRNLMPPSAVALTRSVLEVARAHREQRDVAAAFEQNLVTFRADGKRPGLPVLLAPPYPQHFTEADRAGNLLLNREAYEQVIALALKRWQYVVIDTSQDVSQPGNAAALAAADLVIVPLIPGVAYMREWDFHMEAFMRAIMDGGRQNTAWVRVLFNLVNERLHQAGLAMPCGVTSIGTLRVDYEEIVETMEASDIPVVRYPRGRVASVLGPVVGKLVGASQGVQHHRGRAVVRA